jgi:DNA-binding PadR family transcriptional regulator
MGELEQLILLTVLRLGDDAYGVPILEGLETKANRRLSRGALYTALDRLEAKGLLKSRLGEALAERGGRPRRYYQVSARGLQALASARRTLLDLWRGVENDLAGAR